MRSSFAVVAPDDLRVCREVLGRGSKSFAGAAALLPRRVRVPATVFYAFCRVADDAVDREPRSSAAVGVLTERLDAVYAARPAEDPVDRALAAVVAAHALPRAILDALLEGFSWDVGGRRYETLSDLRAYCVRVAGTVGVAMSLFMGERREPVLRRACDLGVAMQLTNVARDVGEDARAGRLYLPLAWMREAGLDPDRFVRAPAWTPALGELVRTLLDEAAQLYRRAKEGIRMLPRDCRVAIAAASHVYADIGRAIAANGYDSVTRRAYTTAARKAWLVVRALFAALSRTRGPSAVAPLPEVIFLLETVRRR